MKKLKTKTDFDAYIQNDYAIIVWCGGYCPACDMIEEEIDKNQKFFTKYLPFVRIVKMNCDLVPDHTRKIQFVPTLRMYYNNETYTMSEGFVTVEEIKKWIERFATRNKLTLPS